MSPFCPFALSADFLLTSAKAQVSKHAFSTVKEALWITPSKSTAPYSSTTSQKKILFMFLSIQSENFKVWGLSSASSPSVRWDLSCTTPLPPNDHFRKRYCSPYKYFTSTLSSQNRSVDLKLSSQVSTPCTKALNRALDFQSTVYDLCHCREELWGQD